MDSVSISPVAMVLISAIFIIVAGMVLFLQAKNAANELVKATSQELKEHKAIIEQYKSELKYLEVQSQQRDSSDTTFTAELENLKKEVDEKVEEMARERPKFIETLFVATLALQVLKDYTIYNTFRLVNVILEISVLVLHSIHTKFVIPDMFVIPSMVKSFNNLENDAQELKNKVNALVKEREKYLQANQNSININIKSGDYMGSNYNISGGSQGSVGDNAQASNFIQISQQKNETQTLAEAAEEIQKLLQQLERSNPTATEAQQIEHINDETTPKFKRRVVAALKAAGDTAIDEFLDNSYVKVGKAAIMGWMDG